MNDPQSRDLLAELTSAATAGTPDASDESRFCTHAAQLRRGFRWLQFERELEQEFRSYFHQRYLFRTRAMLVGGAVLFALFSLRDYRTLPEAVWHWTVGLRQYLIVPAIALVLAASYPRALARWLELLTTIGVTIAMGGLSAAILISTRMGSPLPYEGLMLVMVYAIFLAGLRFYKATLSTFLTAAAYITARFVLGLPDGETLQQAYYMFGITLIGLVGSYSLELSLRSNFLTEHVALFRAARDSLTQLYNRRAALEHLHLAWRLGFRERKIVAAILLDVDHFKRYNDHYGHPSGDRCLTELATAMRERVRRPMDIVARYGGEEFLAVFYDVTEQNLALIAEDLRRTVEDLGIAHAESDRFGIVTISLGASWADPAAGTTTVEAMLDSADRALYSAKDAGRNRVELRPAAPAAAPGPAGVRITNPAAGR